MPRLDPFTIRLLLWFEQHGRELPWRGSRNAYHIWLSEVILQQTRVAQGIDYWHRFINRFPDVQSLAEASEDEVLKMWQGLGYYSRARNLHHAARQIVALGRFPDTYDEIKRLKGVGDYTAAAIASFAFHLPVAAVDGNAYRVLARVFGISTPINTTRGKKEFTQLAQSLLPTERPHDFNQAMMDFGSVVCTPTAPHCTDCPLADRCEALHNNKVEVLPVKEKRLKVKERRMVYVYLRCQGKTVLRRRGAGDIWQGLYEPLTFIPEGDNVRLRFLRGGVKHVLTHRIIMADFYLAEADHFPSLPDDYFWVEETDLDRYAVPRLVEKLIATVSS